ncbi:MAG: N-acetylornithine carbamoyltransferase [Lysobacteraceae bacterium]|nr:MAG: N-acetylornithine carbamoyltransferase [Xanthomonadaceae bacterium]
MNFLNTTDLDDLTLDRVLLAAEQLRSEPQQDWLAGKSVALIFLNPSMRTRTSMEVGVFQLGGHAVVLQPGKDAWGIEFEPSTVMHGEAEEHIAEVAAVLSRYVDVIGVRAFPKFVDWSVDRQDKVIKAFAQYSTVPVISLETITHPLQELALALTLRSQLGDPRGKQFLLTWTYHPKPLNTAVANSAITIASRLGMDVTLLCPNEDFLLDSRYLDIATTQCSQHGRSFEISHDIATAYSGKDFVYAKSWGALPWYGNWAKQQPQHHEYKHFIVDEEKMSKTNNARFSHCLPLRRNIKATDAVMDAPYCVAAEEAENRLHAQKAVLGMVTGALS